MSSWEPIAEHTPLLQAFHNMSPSRQPNMLALEVFLLVRWSTRTYDELERTHRPPPDVASRRPSTLLTVQGEPDGDE